ncbi:SGNH/GDSL hydrolase family protein [Streptomyces tsukubensis]|uniref:GDSL family lipase n=1 Tax=Streptomyces tsukubensis TaxID=83656 RepID=A0A1V4AFX0_9ACTN|nr:SGNH/GDSL hydrolase family protein [Streptomyces tsukubensis]OON82919.1 GDSL family lipase [Streptomyces tsukubensis]QFR91897.1 SGNH/GDSL hydrolase family protein [Streptomyces tsukubensis]
MPSSRSSRFRPLLTAAAAVTASLAVALGAGAAPASAQAGVGRYVALGDSYASGAGVPTQVDTGCTRSDRNYPSVLGKAVGPAAQKDVTCGGATTVHMTSAQSSSAGPQFDALTADTDLVSVTIGGNDIGFADIITRCVTLGLLSPSGSPCKTSYTWTGSDQLTQKIQATAPKIASVIDGIHQRSPQAKVLVVGYPAILPDDGSNCRSTVTIAKGDAPWLRDTEKRLNSMIASQAASHGAVYVDAYARSVGHDVCKPVGTRWIEPLITSAAAPFHPNAAGEQSMADAARGALG